MLTRPRRRTAIAGAAAFLSLAAALAVAVGASAPRGHAHESAMPELVVSPLAAAAANSTPAIRKGGILETDPTAPVVDSIRKGGALDPTAPIVQ